MKNSHRSLTRVDITKKTGVAMRAARNDPAGDSRGFPVPFYPGKLVVAGIDFDTVTPKRSSLGPAVNPSRPGIGPAHLSFAPVTHVHLFVDIPPVNSVFDLMNDSRWNELFH